MDADERKFIKNFASDREVKSIQTNFFYSLIDTIVNREVCETFNIIASL
jgi:hypothetical protein